ncbi:MULTISPECIES: cellulose biosynthesis protein BcsG [Pantoea]|jgi:cellulose synthase operon protein YhjU|uniref:cellulose biosynthesis protein BcsG n=1 Tax=Pantoea TaxID=53335 RepID=UPI000EA16843|nr:MULTISPECIES: cellulose biosynthesis protein BcsG [Pantoea]MBZ6387294.1 cellulose biosynthesis protein BcsG [Pantoea piersonii]MBZ6400614.1 cellulose biosynthesis protein BcsG [Pantoea piersonii]MBZ6408594.1 cellulose biosynthesis protein BcsG [Pantoea piersonii]MBZ6426923.1 cellulose biosynthesis protein BcsG [Pantoea piersonii]NYB04696.1 cellulose biosynthesis protein BcsG [Pantoea piersonii]
MNNDQSTSAHSSRLWSYWRGLGGWNFYFLLKFGLLWYGYLNFHALSNLIFLAWLLFPLPSPRLHRLRSWISLPIGFGLFWHDTWLPGIESILSQGNQVAGFSGAYLLDLVNRFINWQMIGAAFVLLVLYLFISQWVRVTVLVSLMLIWLNVLTIAGPALSLLPTKAATPEVVLNQTPAAGQPQAASAPDGLDQSAPPTSANLTAWLNRFYDSERKRVTHFPDSLPADSQPFDILVVNICSLAWSDMDVSQLRSHPLWQHFDIVLNNYNSATGYSGPAGIRLLRASCGQTSHSDLYKPTDARCYLFDNLARLGFKEQLMMDHTGVFGNYLKELRDDGNIQAPLMSQAGIAPELTSFDGSPVFNDAQLMQRWLDDRSKSSDARSATFYNLIPLHDGTRDLGSTQTAPWKPRAQVLFDQLDAFLTNLEKSGRRVMVLVVPEHGAALQGDKMQMSGLRDIPSPSITHVPVGIKFVGMKAPHQGQPLTIDTPASLLAISELVSRVVDGQVFNAPNVNMSVLADKLPQTPVVSENDNAVVMMYQGKPWIRLNGGDWVAYPQ